MAEPMVESINPGWARPLLLLIALWAAGCRQPELAPSIHDRPTGGGADTALGRRREASMNERWQNRPLSQLITAMGEPRMLMNIPGGGNPPGFVAVYGIDQWSGCLDTFALFYGINPVIRVYHCR